MTRNNLDVVLSRWNTPLVPRPSRSNLFLATLLGSALAVGPVDAPEAAATRAVEVAGVHFAPEYAAGEERLELRGAALLRWRRVLEAYVAALYLPPLTPKRDALEDVPKRLEIEYFWAIRAEDLGRAADQLLSESLDAETFATLRSRLVDLHAAYESVEPGDRYALEYRPHSGTVLSKNGRTLAVIPGADFSAAYFSMWLGESPIDAGMRDRLLGTIPMRAQE